MKNAFAKQILCASVCMAVMAGMTMTGCAATVNAAETSAEATTVSSVVTASQGAETKKGPGSQEKPEKKQNGQMAKVVSVADDELTVMLAVQPERGEKPEKAADGNEGERPEKPADGAEMPEKPADGTEPPEKPADGNGADMPKGGKGGHQGMEMTFSEETTVLTLTDDTVITKGMGQEAESISVSDLEADSVIRVILDETTVVSIELMEMLQE